MRPPYSTAHMAQMHIVPKPIVAPFYVVYTAQRVLTDGGDGLDVDIFYGVVRRGRGVKRWDTKMGTAR